MQIKQLLRQGCQAYLAYVLDTNKESPKIEDIPIVCEFPYVFPDELPGLLLGHTHTVEGVNTVYNTIKLNFNNSSNRKQTLLKQ